MRLSRAWLIYLAGQPNGQSASVPVPALKSLPGIIKEFEDFSSTLTLNLTFSKVVRGKVRKIFRPESLKSIRTHAGQTLLHKFLNASEAAAVELSG